MGEIILAAIVFAIALAFFHWLDTQERKGGGK